MPNNPPAQPLFAEDLAPWNDNNNSVWLASTFLLRRNVDKFLFPGKLDADKRKQMVSFVGREMLKLKGFSKPTLLKSEECTPYDKEFLVEHCLVNDGFMQSVQGEAFFFDAQGDFLFTINIQDHIHFRSIDVKGELEKSWNRILQFENELGKTVSYAYSDKFGFLAANPAHSGTGLDLELFLQLSALIHTGSFPTVMEKLKDESIEVAGLVGASKDWVGDLVVIKNKYCLGVNEEAIIAPLRNLATKLVLEEGALRSKLKEQESGEVKDKVSRAYGLLTHSYQIETIEALNEIALLKLGLDLGWIGGVTMNALNKLFFTCRRGHLLRHLEGKVALEEVAHKRAEFIHSALKNVTIAL